jgi:hypothetical protein
VLILGAFATIIVASLAPVLRNADLNIDGAGPFTQVIFTFCCSCCQLQPLWCFGIGAVTNQQHRSIIKCMVQMFQECIDVAYQQGRFTDNSLFVHVQKAEVVNGRIAMVAFALLIAVETWKAGPGLVP